jgi:hypothetical protein
MHDLLDHLERVLGAFTETDECDVRPFSCCQGPDLLDADLARDHLMPKSGDDRDDQGQAILALVRDQYAQVLGLTLAQTTLLPVECSAPEREPNSALDGA